MKSVDLGHVRINERLFWDKVSIGSGDGCWIWTASLDKAGYGHFLVARKSRPAHRVSWYLKHGSWPECALHKCDNRACVNPDHLFNGSKADNNQDRDAKGRHIALHGEKNGFAKMTAAMVASARVRCANGETQTDVAQELGVSVSTVHLAVKRKTWRHVP